MGRIYTSTKLAVSGGLVDPRDAGGLVAWWRSDLGVTLAGSVVATWADQSGGGNTLTGAGAARPAFSSAAVNGFGAIVGDGIDDTMTASFTLTPPFTRVAVWKAITLGTSGVSDAIMSGGASNRGLLIDNTSPQAQMFNGSFLGPASSINSTAYGCTVEIYNGTTSALRNNGAQLAAGDVGATAATGGLSLFQNGGGGRFSNTGIVEIAIYSVALPTHQVAALELYAKQRYNL